MIWPTMASGEKPRLLSLSPLHHENWGISLYPGRISCAGGRVHRLPIPQSGAARGTFTLVQRKDHAIAFVNPGKAPEAVTVQKQLNRSPHLQ